MAFFAVGSMVMLNMIALGTNPTQTIAEYRNEIASQAMKIQELETKLAGIAFDHKKDQYGNLKKIE